MILMMACQLLHCVRKQLLKKGWIDAQALDTRPPLFPRKEGDDRVIGVETALTNTHWNTTQIENQRRRIRTMIEWLVLNSEPARPALSNKLIGHLLTALFQYCSKVRSNHTFVSHNLTESQPLLILCHKNCSLSNPCLQTGDLNRYQLCQICFSQVCDLLPLFISETFSLYPSLQQIYFLSSFAWIGNSIIKQPLRSDFLGLRRMAVRGRGKWSGHCGELMAPPPVATLSWGTWLDANLSNTQNGMLEENMRSMMGGSGTRPSSLR